MRTETFYGIRIGDPRWHMPYLRITGCDNRVQLFDKINEAEEEFQRCKTTGWKVVKVKVSYAG